MHECSSSLGSHGQQLCGSGTFKTKVRQLGLGIRIGLEAMVRG